MEGSILPINWRTFNYNTKNMSWKQEILEAFKNGKTIQYSMYGNHWRDFYPHSPIDVPNVEYGTQENWRIKPEQDTVENPWEEKKYSKEEMLLFAGFCVGRKKVNPTASGSDLWEDWERDFPHE